jgi:hypothetical protein
MPNKLKYLGILAGLATFLVIIGEWARITHQRYAENIFAIGMWSLAACAGIFAYLKISSPANKN